ncbi:MAG TPA: hypothetical protein VF440_13295 [Novosphingobium sp.]
MTRPDPDPAPDPAKARYFVIQAARVTGALLVAVGLLALNHKIDLPLTAGYGLVLLGLFEALLMPTFLSRRWKSPPE